VERVTVPERVVVETCFTPKSLKRTPGGYRVGGSSGPVLGRFVLGEGLLQGFDSRFWHTTGRLPGVLIRIGQEAISEAWLSDQVSRPTGMRLQLAAQVSNMRSKVVGLCAIPRAPHCCRS
jgi:hypothetical protein